MTDLHELLKSSALNLHGNFELDEHEAPEPEFEFDDPRKPDLFEHAHEPRSRRVWERPSFSVGTVCPLSPFTFKFLGTAKLQCGYHWTITTSVSQK